jgi:hypothetical protein
VAFLLGLGLAVAVGMGHHLAIAALAVAVRWLSRHGRSPILPAFCALLALHAAEILAYAGAYAAILHLGWFGGLAGAFSGGWEGLITFSGINFTTLGNTAIEVEGSLRLVAMLQSLAGFMLLTWSATFLYSVCARSWQEGP